MNRIFFYGLFMDQALLAGKGICPTMLGPAVLIGYRIHIGARATLRPSASGRAYGLVMELTDEEARLLYSEPGVREYVPEHVRVELLASGEAVEADCYNLPPGSGSSGTNPAYAAELSRLAEALRFDPVYVEEIRVFGEAS